MSRKLAAFRRTEYEAAGAIARIGRRSLAIDALLRRMGVREAVFLTAWNPWARRRPLGWNARMQIRQREALRRFPLATGHGQGPRWCEAHLLAGVPAQRAACVARRFRQVAIVVVRAGRKAELVVLSPPSC